jgi:hypothetical protein
VDGETPGFSLEDPGFSSISQIFLLMNTVNPVQFYPRNQGLNLDPGSTNSSRITPRESRNRKLDDVKTYKDSAYTRTCEENYFKY